MMSDLLDGAEKELSPHDQKKYAEAFASFKLRLSPQKKIGNRKTIERDVESFLDSDDAIREAASVYLGKRVLDQVPRAEGLLRRAEKVLRQVEDTKPREPSKGKKDRNEAIRQLKGNCDGHGSVLCIHSSCSIIGNSWTPQRHRASKRGWNMPMI
jgi:hypothetical protein